MVGTARPWPPLSSTNSIMLARSEGCVLSRTLLSEAAIVLTRLALK